MFNVTKYFFCDEVSQGNFGKLNYIGYFPNNEIAVNSIPYILTTTVVIDATSIAHVIGSPEIQIQISSGNQPICASTIRLPEVVPKNANMILAFPIRLNANKYGTYIARIFLLDRTLFSFEFNIKQGLSPNYYVGNILPTSGSIDPIKGNHFLIEDLFESATNNLLIIDGYLKPDFLISVISKSRHSPIIRILTYPKLESLYKESLPKIAQINPKIIVKYSDHYHDRFCLINNTELYVFGHSFKDLNRNKSSFFSKVVNQKEVEKILNTFESIWTTLS